MAPDRLLARAEEHVLLYVQSVPANPSGLDGTGSILTNWEAASPGYHLVATDPAVVPPGVSGQVVDNDTRVIFEPSRL